MTAHLTNEHSPYSVVRDVNDPPHRIINNIEIPQGAVKMYWICSNIFVFFVERNFWLSLLSFHLRVENENHRRVY